MAWSAPMTAVANAIFSAAQFNQYVRDNLNETAPAKATGAAQFFVSTGANAIAARQLANATVATAQTTASTSYTNLATTGPQVSVATGPRALVLFASSIDNTVTNGASSVSVAVSGATTIAASGAWRLARDGVASTNTMRYGAAHLFTTLNTGTNVFTMQYLVGSGTGTFSDRELVVLPF
jgi:hypothetical protein